MNLRVLLWLGIWATFGLAAAESGSVNFSESANFHESDGFAPIVWSRGGLAAGFLPNGEILVARGAEPPLRWRFLGAKRGKLPVLTKVEQSFHVARLEKNQLVSKTLRRGRSVEINDLFSGVSLEFHDRTGRLEFDVFGLARDLRAVRWSLPGKLRALPDGGIRIGPLLFAKPIAFQQDTKIEVGYRTFADGSIGFQLGDHDPDKPILIDPPVDVVSFVGGGSSDTVFGVAADQVGAVYLTGETSSTNFLNIRGALQTRLGFDAFVTKFNPDGTLAFNLILQGAGRDTSHSVAVEASGIAHVTGRTTSSNFPTTPNGHQRTLGGSEDAFYVRLTANGTIQYSTLLGGLAQDIGWGIALDGTGSAYVAGQTSSNNFPTVGSPLRATYSGGLSDCFITKYSGTSPSYSTYYGGSGLDLCRHIAVGSDGNAVVVGTTNSPNLPLSRATQSTLAGGTDAFVAQLNAAGSQLLFGTFLGGLSTEEGNGIALSGGTAIATGATGSSNFPLAAATQNTLRGASDAFLTWFNLSAGTMTRSTFWGGSQNDVGMSLAAANSGRIWLTGFSNSSDFPSATPRQAYGGAIDAFLTGFEASGAQFSGTLLGGSGDDRGFAVAVDGGGEFVVGGSTTSANFPTTVSAIQANPGGGLDGWFYFVRNNTTPSVTGVSPVNGAGVGSTFSVTVSDPDGNADIGTVRFQVSSTASAVNACVVELDAVNSQLRLMGNDGINSPGQIPVGSGTSSNTQCTLRGAGSTVGRNGNSLTATFVLEFNSGFVGAKTTYAATTDRSGLTAALSPVGGFTVSFNSAPVNGNLTPLNATAPAQVFSVTTTDTNGNSDLASVQMIVNTTAAVANGCAVTYDGIANTFALSNDAGSSNAGVIAPGSTTDMSNSTCTIVGRQTLVSRNGNQLTISVAIQAKFRGSRNVYVSARDRSNATDPPRQLGTWNLLANFAPAPQFVNPPSGSGTQQVFSVVASDPDGNADIGVVRLFVGPSTFAGGTTVPTNGCFLVYSSTANTLQLMADNGTTVAGTLTPGVAASAANTRCTVFGNQSAVIRNGNLLTVNVGIQFLAAFQGNQALWMRVEDRSNQISDWQNMGSWNLSFSNAAPTVTRVSPSSGGAYAQAFTIEASDSNGATDITELRFLISSYTYAPRNCEVVVNLLTNTIRVSSDTGTLPTSGISPGSSAIGNSQCSVTGAGSSISKTGSVLRVVLNMQFQSALQGTRNLYSRATDVAGANSGWRFFGQWTLLNGARPVFSVAPMDGNTRSVDFWITATHPNGQANIKEVRLVMNSILNGENGCQLIYDNGTRSISITANDGNTILGPVPVGLPAIVSNSQCRLSGPSTAVFRSGNSLTLRMGVQMQPGWNGNMKFWIKVTDFAGLDTGFVESGKWILQ